MSPTALHQPTEKFNVNLEALRGFAAVFVVWHHLYMFGHQLSPGYRPSYLFDYGPSGHFCVLLFFILSGYVIGQSQRQPLGWASSGTYLKKRLVRLYPILLLTLGLAIAVSPLRFSFATILGNVAMLQTVAVPNINSPAWSLHYEMLYYLLFIPVSALRLRPLAIIAVALVLALGNFLLYPALPTPIISSYCYGLIFWLVGLFLSERLAGVPSVKVPYQVLLGCLLFVLCIDQYNVLTTLSRKFIHVAFPANIAWEQQAIEFYDLAALPVALLVVVMFIGKQLPHSMLLVRGLFLVLAIPKVCYLFVLARHGDLNSRLYFIPTLLLVAALLCLCVRSAGLERASRAVIQAGSRLGQLSYGIYLVHFPLLTLFSRFNGFSGTGFTFAVRLVLFLGLVVLSSYWLERVVQPRIRAWFFPRPAAGRASVAVPPAQVLSGVEK